MFLALATLKTNPKSHGARVPAAADGNKPYLVVRASERNFCKGAISFQHLQGEGGGFAFWEYFWGKREKQNFLKNAYYIRQHHSVYLLFQAYVWNNSVYKLVVANLNFGFW